jgi:hypothetical protein
LEDFPRECGKKRREERTFVTHFPAAAAASPYLARQFMSEPLPDAIRFRMRLNQLHGTDAQRGIGLLLFFVLVRLVGQAYLAKQFLETGVASPQIALRIHPNLGESGGTFQIRFLQDGKSLISTTLLNVDLPR